MLSKRLLGLAAAALFAVPAGSALAAPVLFWSDQGTPVEEQQAMRDTCSRASAARSTSSRRTPARWSPASRPKPRPARAPSA